MMLPNNHRFTMLSADDVALCRAHSRAIATPPKVRAAVHSMCAAMSDCKQAAPQLPDDLPMPPSYWDDLEHWLKTLAPAKPAGPQPCQAPAAWDGVHRYGNRAEYDKALAELFVSGQAIAPTPMSYIDFSEAQWDGSPKIGVVGIGNLTIDCGGSTICNGASACRGFETKKHYRDWFRSLRDPGLAAQLASTSSADGAALIGERPAEPRTIPVPWDQWHDKAMRDIVKPAQQPAQNASTHSVCIKAHKSLVFNSDIGTVLPLLPNRRSRPECWLPCDESGWVTHVPTADAVCPVPDGVLCQIKQGDEVCGNTLHNPPRTGDQWYGWDQIINAWRPVAQS